MKVTKSMKTLVAAIALALASPMASAFNVFEIDEGSIPGSFSNIVTADTINGNYSEVFTATSATDFATTALFLGGNYVLGGTGGVNVQSQLNGLSFLGGYGLYATFTATGTFSVVGTTTSFSATGGVLSVWADPDQNTVGTLPAFGGGAVTFVGDGEDIQLANASVLLFGEGNGCVSCTANGNFELLFGDFVLTSPEGEAFFISPVPFYGSMDVNGNFQAFDPTGATSALLDGSANAFFAPEPESLALAGLSLVLASVFGFRRRR